ncbi:MAG: hypothetical protein WD314_08805 [Trueperaceae bacterium]
MMLGNWLGGKPDQAENGEGSGEAGGRRRRRARQSPRAALNSRYAGISEYLKEQSGQTAEASFGDIEKAIGSNLPASAERHRAWWANTERNTQARVWMEEGWRVDRVDFDNRTVSFSRN